MTIDEKISSIENEIKKNKEDLKNAKREKAMEDGILFSKPDEIICKLHTIPYVKMGDNREDAEPPIEFGCPECRFPSAYECPECGIVKGRYKTEEHDDRRNLAGTAGEEYFCRICGKMLGRYIWGHS